MTLTELKNHLLPLWPSTIRIGDGYATANDGFMFPSLNKVYRRIEDGLDVETDHWGVLGHWAMSQAIHKMSRDAFGRGITVVSIADVPDELLDYFVRCNLSEESWTEERALYQG